MNKKEKTTIILLIFIFTIIAFGSLATYAYFKVKEYKYGNFEVEITSKGVDTLEFVDGKNALLNINFNNFRRDSGHNVSDDALLNIKLNTSKDTAEFCYKFDIVLPDEKIFSYSDENPEFVLNVSKGTNNNNYINLIENMDITEKTGIINIPTSLNGSDFIHHIKTTKTNEIRDNLKATFTFIYKNIDQNLDDEDKIYNAHIDAYLVNCNDGSLYTNK